MSDTVKIIEETTIGIKESLESDAETFTLPLKSVEGREIQAFHFQNGPAQGKLLLIGGVHGDESEGVHLANEYLRKIQTYGCPEGLEVIVVPNFNPDGVAADQRKNANSVDLNRNMPTKDWTSEVAKEKYFPGTEAASEPEVKAMIALVDSFNPDMIISCHSYEPMLNYNGPAKELAEKMAEANGYIITADIGYPTPGSLGTWAGWEREIPTITFEVERGMDEESNWKVNEGAIDNAIDFLLKK